MKYNVWVQKAEIKDLKKKCIFVLFKRGKVVPYYHSWSEVYWTDEAMNNHPNVKYEKTDSAERITWVVPKDCRIDGFDIIHDTRGILFSQTISNGVELYIHEEINLDISGIYIIP